MNLIHRLVLLAAVAVAASGCGNVCDRMCDAQADMIEGCLPTWETTWNDLSYDSRDHFLDRCYAVWGDSLGELDKDDPERDAIQARCQRDLETARSDADCQSLLSVDP